MKPAIFFLLAVALVGCSTAFDKKVTRIAPQVTFGKTPIAIAIDKKICMGI